MRTRAESPRHRREHKMTNPPRRQVWVSRTRDRAFYSLVFHPTHLERTPPEERVNRNVCLDCFVLNGLVQESNSRYSFGYCAELFEAVTGLQLQPGEGRWVTISLQAAARAGGRTR